MASVTVNYTTPAHDDRTMDDSILNQSNAVDPKLMDRYLMNRAIDEPAYSTLIVMYSLLIVLGALGNTLVVSCVVGEGSKGVSNLGRTQRKLCYKQFITKTVIKNVLKRIEKNGGGANIRIYLKLSIKTVTRHRQTIHFVRNSNHYIINQHVCV